MRNHRWSSPLRPLGGIGIRLLLLALTSSSLTAFRAPSIAAPAPALDSFSSPRSEGGDDGVWWPVPLLGIAPASAPVAALVGSAPGELLGTFGPRQMHTVIFDSARQRFIAFGGTEQPGGTRFNDLWTRDLSATGNWQQLAANDPPPSARYAHSAIYDPVGDRMIVMGGYDGSIVGDLWQLSLAGTPQWSPLATLGTPPSARMGHSACYDPTHHRMVVFGGETPVLSDEAWFLDLNTSPPTWVPGAPGSPRPPARSFHTAIADVHYDRLVIFGGIGTDYLGDVWTLPLGTSVLWAQRFPTGTGPGALGGAKADYDPVGNRMVIVGGRYYQSHSSTVWGLELGSFVWGEVAMSSALPPPRHAEGFALDPVTRRGVLSGGVRGGDPSYDDTWRLDLTPPASWTFLAGTIPSDYPQPPPNPFARRYAFAGALDLPRARYVAVGGAQYPSAGPTLPYPLKSVITLTLGTDSSWVEVNASGDFTFKARYGHSVIYDPLRDRLIVFGGFDGTTFLNDLWEVRLAPAIEFHQLFPVAAVPQHRAFHSAVYDPVRDRMIVFGGNEATGFRNDTWALSLSGTLAWTGVLAQGTPPGPRLAHRAIYDPYSDRMLVFGGYGGPGANESRNDLWSLSLGGTPAWAQLSPTGTPPGPRHSHSFDLDPTRQRAVVYGGLRQENGFTYGDLWELSVAGAPAWHSLEPGGPGPPSRYSHLAIIDPIRDRLLITGGYAAGLTLSDVWRLQWSSDVPTATTMGLISSLVRSDRVELRWDVEAPTGAIARIERQAPGEDWRTVDQRVLDGSRLLEFEDRAVQAFARYGYRVAIDEGGTISRSSETWVEIPASDDLALLGFAPNPGTAQGRVAFRLPDSRRATLELIDVGGRRISHVVLEHPAAGTTTIDLAPERGIEPGLYFIRLTQGDRTIVRRGTVVR